jgi:hypothetical protein
MDDMSRFSMENRAAWRWTLMILQPAVITKSLFAKALKQAKEKKGIPALVNVRLEPYSEGLSVQIMYVGPYADEGPTIQKLHAVARERGCELRGKHHEIYLGDPRKSKPERLKTVVRQPIHKIRSGS